MKRIFFGMAVAISASAFTNAKSINDIYAQVSAGFYVVVDYNNDSACFVETDLPSAYSITQAGHDAGI